MLDLTMDHHSQVFQPGPEAPHVTPPAPPEDPARTSLRRTLAQRVGHDPPVLVLGGPLGGLGPPARRRALTLGMVYINVLFNQWNNAFFNALQEKNQAAFLQQLIRVSWLSPSSSSWPSTSSISTRCCEIRWRRWLTERYLRAWLADGAYYRMQLVAGETDNPDQRIAEDLHLLVSDTLGLFVGGLRAVVTLATFVAILWGLSGTLTVPLGGISITLPGYMVWAALLYAIAGTWLTDWIGRPLVRLNFDRQRYEADFRFSLVRFRENTEGRGPLPRRGRRAPRLPRAVRGGGAELVGHHAPAEAADLLHRRLRPGGVDLPVRRRGARATSGASSASAGSCRPTGAFQQVQDALSFFVQSYKEIAAWRAVVERLAGFERALERVRLQAATGGGVRRAEGGAAHLAVEDVELDLPDGQPLIANVNLSLVRGDTVLLGGASGSGKSTLVRAIAGIWPFGRGEIRAPQDARILFLPQRPYLPIGTLRDVVSYPMPAGGIDDATLREALEAVGLPELAGRLDEATTLGAPALPRRAAAHRLRPGPGPEARLALPRRGDLGGG